jgi:ArsR family transcriptional regulator
MLAAGVLSRRKEGIKIIYAIKHPEIMSIVDLATRMVKQEIAGRHELLKAV